MKVIKVPDIHRKGYMSVKSYASAYKARAFYLGKKMLYKGLKIGFAIGMTLGIFIGFAFFYG